jgi:hypothetical protein
MYRSAYGHIFALEQLATDSLGREERMMVGIKARIYTVVCWVLSRQNLLFAYYTVLPKNKTRGSRLTAYDVLRGEWPLFHIP